MKFFVTALTTLAVGAMVSGTGQTARAADGVTGLHLAVVHDFDAIVLDLNLPDAPSGEVVDEVPATGILVVEISSFQLETVAPELFWSFQQELCMGSGCKGVFHRFDSGSRMALGAVSWMTVETTAKIGSWCWRVGDEKPVWSPGLFRLFNLDPSSETPYVGWVREQVHPDDRAIFDWSRDMALKSLREFEAEGDPYSRDILAAWAQGKQDR